MSAQLITTHDDLELDQEQLELLNQEKKVFLETEKYHAIGKIKEGNLIFPPDQKNNLALLKPLLRDNLHVGLSGYPFENLEVHVYFTDTDYPILYKQFNTTLHFFLPGSGINYNNEELADNPKIFSRVSLNYFDFLLSHDKPLNEIFRNFQFNGIDCSKIREIRMSGESLGGGMQHFLIVYVLQNAHIFSNLEQITLDVVQPTCFHPKIIASINSQFNDALLQTNQELIIRMNYIMHLKDPVPRRGNPFILKYDNSGRHNIIYGVELYAYCEEAECEHKMQDVLSDKNKCDIVCTGKEFKKYHNTAAGLKEHCVYEKFTTSDFRQMQDLIDDFFASQHYYSERFYDFFVYSHGDKWLKNIDLHFIIFAYENLADAVFEKYKSQCDFSDDDNHKISNLNKIMNDLENLKVVRVLRKMARKQKHTQPEYRKWYSKYLELCGAKSELAKLAIFRSIN